MVFLVLGILFFLAWLATFFVFAIGHLFTYIFLFLAIIFIIVHFILMYGRRSKGQVQL